MCVCEDALILYHARSVILDPPYIASSHAASCHSATHASGSVRNQHDSRCCVEEEEEAVVVVEEEGRS